ncbi:MAG: autotransporter outer membrane beta-barrel domain-containing protein, partial [Amylibacter sp.]
NKGTGALSITTTGTTTGGKGGINAYNEGTSLTINTLTTTTGGENGIVAVNSGTGALSITTMGDTTGTDKNGINAYNKGTSLTIKAATTTGGTFGIAAVSSGTGALSITTTGDTTGGDGAGIQALSQANTTGDLTINAANTTGYNGIFADNEGTGALSITTTGTTKGTAKYGIGAINSSLSTGDLTIKAATTAGATDGIYADNRGTGTLNITTSGAITGGTSYGIAALTLANKMTNITLNSGAVSSTAGLGIFNNGGNSTTTVNTGASVAGKIVLGDGVDSLNFAGGDFSDVTLFDGGAGTSDILKFSGSSGSVNGSLIKNWESVEINKDSTIAFSNNKLTTGMLKTNTGGTLNAISGTFALTGNLSNAGTVNMVNAKTSDKVTVSGTSTGGGQIKMDVNAKTNKSDKLAIAGNSSGKTTLAFKNLSPGKETGSTIADVVTVAGTSSATDFSGSMLGGIYTYKLTYDAGSLDLVGALNSTASVYKVAPTVLGGFNQMSSLNQRKSYRQVESRSDKASSTPKVALTEQRQPNVWLDTGWTRAQEKTPSGISFENTNQDLTLGVDFDVDAGGSSGNWVVGGYVQSGTQEASITDATGTGSITSRGRGIGATATWYGNAGTYVDAQGQITRLESDMSSSAGGVLAESVSSKAYALSLEVGHHIALSEKAGLIPQGQLSWGRIDGAEFTDTGNTAVDMGSNDTQTGRVGLAYEYVIDNQSTFYAIGSIVRDFKRANKVKAGTASFSEDINETWGEIGIGGSIVLDEASGFGSANKTTKLYGGVFQRQSSNNSDIKVLAVNAGIQIEW